MITKLYSYGICGLDAYPIKIEVDVSSGLPSTVIVGLPDNAIKESKERVRTAIKNCGFKFPAQRITINLSPADVKKEGPAFDLPICLGLLGATEQIDASHLSEFVFLGELSLDGTIHPIKGALCIALALKQKFKGLILPVGNIHELSGIENVPFYPVKHLSEVIELLQNSAEMTPWKKSENTAMPSENFDTDFSDVKGQSLAKRGLEIAAAGGHNIILIGPPGSGKTMLAKRLPTILPEMTREESLETTKIHSVMGLLNVTDSLLRQRPFRSPHHTSSDVALVGGGSEPKPGEVTLAHNGILFLDELPEFNRNVLEVLRQPLEDYYVTIARVSKTIRFPSRFMLVCTMNPCPCGWLTDPRKECHCSAIKIQNYISKISGPLLDRIDLHLEVSSLKASELMTSQVSERSEKIRERVLDARERQKVRFKHCSIFSNAHMNHRHIKNVCILCEHSKTLLKAAIERLGLTARSHDKIIKIARTIADLAKTETILPEHIAEAIQFRSLDRDWWK